MSFEDLEREHLAAVADLTASLDLSSGIEDVLDTLERGQALDDLRDVLNLELGAAAVLRAAGIVEEPLNAEANQHGRYEASPCSVEATESSAVDESAEDALQRDVADTSATLDAVVRRIKKVDQIMTDLGWAISTDLIRAPSLAVMQIQIMELSVQLVGRSIAWADADLWISDVKSLLGQLRREVQGYAPRVNGLENEIVGLRGQVYRLFHPSGDVAFSEVQR